MTSELAFSETRRVRALTTSLRLGIVFTLFLAPLWVLPRGFSPTAAKLSLALFGMGAIFCLTLVRQRMSRHQCIQLPWVLFATTPFVAAAGLSLLGAENLFFAAGSTLLIAVFILFGWSISTTVTTALWQRRILAVILASATVSALLAFAQYIGLLGDPTLGPIERAGSTFVNRNFLGAFLGVAALPSLSLLFRRDYTVVQWLAIPSIPLCLFVMTVNEQTGILLAFVVGLLFLAVGSVIFRTGPALARYRRGLLATILILVLGVGSGLALWTSSPSTPLKSTSGGIATDLWYSNSGTTRFVLWGTALEMFQNQIITGVGIGNYKNRFLEYRAIYHQQPTAPARGTRTGTAEQAHNDYLQLIAELGLPGIFALLCLVAATAVFFWRRLRALDHAEDRLHLLFLLSGVVVATAHAVVSFPFHMPISALVVVSLLGLAASRSWGEHDWLGFSLSKGFMRGLLIVLGILIIGMGIVLGREFFAHKAYVQGRIDAEAGKHEAALAAFENCIGQSPSHADAHYQLAVSALTRSAEAAAVGDTSNARSYERVAYAHAKRSQASYPTEKGLLLLAGIASNLGYSEEARGYAERLIDSVPFLLLEMDARYILASDHARQDEIAEAQVTLDALLGADALIHGQAYVLKAALLSRAGQSEEARRLLLDAQDLLASEIEDLSRQESGRSRHSQEWHRLRMSRALQDLDAVRNALNQL